MESEPSEDEESLRDTNVDLNDDNIEQHVALEVSSQLADDGNLYSSFQQISENLEPFVGMEFESEEAAKQFYMAYASRVGFSVRISKSRRSRNDESIIMRRFVCSKEGFHQKKGQFDNGKKKRKRATIREGCNAMIEVIQKYYGRWVVTKLVKEHNHVVEPPSRVRYAPEAYADMEPFLGMEFHSHEAAQTFYYAYASRVGFDVRIRLSRRSSRDESFVMRRFVCTKEGFTPYDDGFDENKKKRSRTPMREGCKAMFEVIKKDHDKWIVSKLITEHTHDLAVAPSKVHYIQSQTDVVVLAKSGSINHDKTVATNLKTQLVESFGVFNDQPSIDEVIGTDSKEARQYMFGEQDSQNLLDNFKRIQSENPSFYYAFQVDKNYCLTNVFWADAKARMAYCCFGDAVTLDMSYKENKDMMPFVTFSGVNHHLQTVVFGCALLSDETKSSFFWLLENWLIAMCGRAPVSLISDQHEAVGEMIPKVFPETRHIFCKWHILRKCKEKLCNIYATRPSFEQQFENCITESETIEAFESSWKSIVEMYNLGENSWVQLLYSIRQKWVPVYLNNTFTAEISATRRPESLNKFFERYFNLRTPLHAFFLLFEQAMTGWYEKEALEDLASQCTRPILKTPSNMLKQVAEVYTPTIFEIFQEEFVESLGYYCEKIEDDIICKYKVIKEEDVHVSYTVTYDHSEKRTGCSCCKFETSGILCKHILRVFLTVGVRALPEYYILKRWTRDAKSGLVLNELVWYSEIYRDAVKYAREGSTSEEVYSIAKHALQMAYAEVVAKKDIISRCTI